MRKKIKKKIIFFLVISKIFYYLGLLNESNENFNSTSKSAKLCTIPLNNEKKDSFFINNNNYQNKPSINYKQVNPNFSLASNNDQKVKVKKNIWDDEDIDEY